MRHPTGTTASAAVVASTRNGHRSYAALLPRLSPPKLGRHASQVFDGAGVVVLTSFEVARPLIPRWEFDVAMDDAAGPPRSLQGNPEQKPGSQSPSGSSDVVTVRKNFPETWLFNLYTVDDGETASFPQQAPDTITSWVLNAFAVSNATGFGVSPPAALNVFQPFFVQASLPYSVIRGEVLEVKVAVFNYLAEASNVSLSLASSNDYEVGGSDKASLVVPAGSPGGASFFIRPSTLGHIAVTVTARSDRQTDAAQQMLLVKPEGVAQEYSSSVFLQLDEENSAELFALDVNYNQDFVVPGSARVHIKATADVMGPSIQGLERLVRLPSGCGEQNMITFAPVVSVAYYLEHTGQFSGEIRSKAEG